MIKVKARQILPMAIEVNKNYLIKFASNIRGFAFYDGLDSETKHRLEEDVTTDNVFLLF